MKAPLEDFEKRNFSFFHIKVMLVAGAGAFVEGYDITAAGTVLSAIQSDFGVDLSSISLIIYVSLVAGTIVGAYLFGYLARLGRKRFYGIDATLMTLGALFSYFVNSPTNLVLFRFILGLGLGADYVLSPTIAAEYSNSKDRGKILGVANAIMWFAGATVAAIVALVLSFYLPLSLYWRTVLALGAIPAAAVIVIRRLFPETPHYLAFVKGDEEGLKRYYNISLAKNVTNNGNIIKRILPTLLLAGLAWYLYDVVIYANFFFGPSYLAKLLGISGAIAAIISYSIVVIFGIPVALLTDKIGRKKVQIIGFAGMGIALLGFSMVLGMGTSISLLPIIMYFSYTFFNTFMLTISFWGVELFPSRVRTLTQATTFVMSRLGVLTTAILFPILVSTIGNALTIGILAAVSLAGVYVTALLPEPNQKYLSLTEIQGVIESTVKK